MHRGTRRLRKSKRIRSKTMRVKRHTRRHKGGGSVRRRQVVRGNNNKPVLQEMAATQAAVKELDRYLSIENASNSGQRKMKIEGHAREDRDLQEPVNQPIRYSSIAKHLRSFKAPKKSIYPNAYIKDLNLSSLERKKKLERKNKSEEEHYGFRK
jgi:hypothetical protein